MGSCQAQDTSHSFHNARTYPLQEVLYAPCSDVCLRRKGCTFCKKYIVDAVEPTQAQGFWLTKPFEQEELTSVLWAYKTTSRGSIGETPFSLVYGTEAIIPAELGIPSHRVMNFSEECNENLLRKNLDLIEELREKAFLRIQRYNNINHQFYNRRVKSQSFQVGDLVLRRADALKPIGKLDPTWEGLYKVTSVIGKGAYELEDPEGPPHLDFGMFPISRNTSRKQDPSKGPSGQRGCPLLGSSEGSSNRRGHPPAWVL
ncbi:UNVERIFIED_CONTAM: hypothetical protein Sradi_2015900 [Sesamum radiatum]|uniref:Uncharacterized protein n=1 Tax=Sesamum radiatum TaxID=300843 RepID=A0AAW2TJB8_SESRA